MVCHCGPNLVDRESCPTGSPAGWTGRREPASSAPVGYTAGLSPLYEAHAMKRTPYLAHAALLELARQSATVSSSCTCTKTPLDGWTSLPLSLPEDQLEVVGTLVAPDETD